MTIRDDEAALPGRGRWLRGTVGQLCGERRNVREGRFHLREKGAAAFAEGLSGAVASGLGKVR